MTGRFAITKHSVSWRRDQCAFAGTSAVERNSSTNSQARRHGVVPDHSVLLEKIIHNQTMPQLLDFGQVDKHLCRALAAIAFRDLRGNTCPDGRLLREMHGFLRAGRPKLLVNVHLIAVTI